MDKKMTIAIDAMGGDNAPAEIVRGCVSALSENSSISLTLVGQKDVIEKELEGTGADKSRISIVHASEIITNDESPTQSIRKKKDSSIVVGLNLLRNEEAGAFVSAGSTGALLTGATVIVGRIKGIERPALATFIPNLKGYTLLIDSGANVDCKPVYLQQFAIMGSVYMESIMGIELPRVRLINIGAEKEKGNSLSKDAYELLESSGINFLGNAEAGELPFGAADVAVCDGFTGNIILKYTEGFAKAMFSLIKSELMSSAVSKIGAALASPAFKRIKHSFDPSEVGGAAFLGLNSLVVKAHGSSDAKSVKNAIVQCSKFIEKDIVSKIEKILINA